MKYKPFDKLWEYDIKSLSGPHILELFKSVCIRLLITEKDLKEAKEQLSKCTCQKKK